MNNLEELYKAEGSDYKATVDRFGGDEELLKHFLRKFASDKTFSELQAAVCNGKKEEAFRAAHTLKGICLNLGLNGLYTPVSELTELLRNGEVEKSKALLTNVTICYDEIINLIVYICA